MEEKKEEVSLQEAFKRFRESKKQAHIQQKKQLEQRQAMQKQPEEMDTLRAQFVEQAKKYLGVPYAKRYHEPGDEYYNSELFLDCCALVRRVVQDLQEDFGFRLGRWNQAYQIDTLPIAYETHEEMKPGDLVFYEAIYKDSSRKPQKHNITHVEIFLGGKTGEETIGARWQKGVVSIFDSYKFESKAYDIVKFHYRSIDTWLSGICRSFCPEHEWTLVKWAPGDKSIFNFEDEMQQQDEPAEDD